MARNNSLSDLGGARRAALALCACLALPGCTDLLGPELPSGVVEQTARAYPNVNLPPDQPSYLRSKPEVRSLEAELEDVRKTHVEEAEERLEGRS